MTPFGVVRFGCMLSVGTIHFKDRFCANKKGEVGGYTALPDSAWWWLQLPVGKSWSMTGRPFVCFLAQMGVENASFNL